MPNTIRSAEDLGKLIRDVRKDQRLTQVELAEQSGVGRRFLIELEEGKPTVQIGKVLKVLAMLGIEVAASGPSSDRSS